MLLDVPRSLYKRRDGEGSCETSRATESCDPTENTAETCAEGPQQFSKTVMGRKRSNGPPRGTVDGFRWNLEKLVPLAEHQ